MYDNEKYTTGCFECLSLWNTRMQKQLLLVLYVDSSIGDDGIIQICVCATVIPELSRCPK